jgi:NADH-quinone oxidoreductase subunit G
MKKISIDGREHLIEEGLTILQACEKVGIEIPRFCYHEKLAIAGNCRICLVEVEKSPKPVASCSLNITDGMVIKTQSELVTKARAGIMEFLLINHPLDCPICDQGGECDLQDQAFKYGEGISHYKEAKRAVTDKDLGPLIATHMTRCIHCTRCVRFLEDIAGTNELGAIGRGEEMEITTYIEKSITSELSGNIIDLCPVGALTSKPYAFTARSWELKQNYAIDVMDSLGSHIRIDTRGNEVMRILPQAFEEINEEWISDRTRFSYDGLKYQRLAYPLEFNNQNFTQITYAEAIKKLSNAIKTSNNPLFLSGALTDAETIMAFKNLSEKLGKGICDQEEPLQAFRNSHSYLCHSGLASLEESDFFLLIGTNPRLEVPLLNARLRKAYLNNKSKIFLLGSNPSLNYPYQALEAEISQVLWDIWLGRNSLVKELESSKKPVILVGSRIAAELLDLLEALSYKYKIIRDDWFGLNILHPTVGALNSLALDFIAPSRDYNQDLTIALGADEKTLSGEVVYLGHNGDNQVYSANLILPTPAFTEKSSSLVNLEGRAQRSSQALQPLGEAKPEYQIALDLAKNLGLTLDFDDLNSLRTLMMQRNEIFAQENLFKIYTNPRPYEGKKITKPNKVEYQAFYDSFYLTNAITRSSPLMQKCHENLC